MLIKQADDQTQHLAELQRIADESGQQAKWASKELGIRRAGIRCETQAAYLIDFDFGSSPNWAVIHDLRLEHGNRVAQIDHLLINRWLDVYVLETKSFSSGLKITEDGEFLRWNSYQRRFEGMASPIEQNERHIQVLKDAVKGIALPERMGFRIVPSFQSYVLVDQNARIDRPKRFDASRVIMSDQLKRTIGREIDNENAFIGMIKTAAKIVSGETVESIARQLVALHKPQRQVTTGIPVQPGGQAKTGQAPHPPETDDHSPAEAPLQAQAPSTVAVLPDAPSCKHCQSNKGSILHGKYGYYLRCDSCEKNTALRPTCVGGHSPKVRKDRNNFYQDCLDCGTSVLIFRNSTQGESK